jgi:hypothetical protein
MLATDMYYSVFAEERNHLIPLPSACAPKTPPIICREKEVLHLGYYATNYNVRALLKVNKLFKRFTITLDGQNVSLLLINTLQDSRKRLTLVSVH